MPNSPRPLELHYRHQLCQTVVAIPVVFNEISPRHRSVAPCRVRNKKPCLLETHHMLDSLAPMVMAGDLGAVQERQGRAIIHLHLQARPICTTRCLCRRHRLNKLYLLKALMVHRHNKLLVCFALLRVVSNSNRFCPHRLQLKLLPRARRGNKGCKNGRLGSCAKLSASRGSIAPWRNGETRLARVWSACWREGGLELSANRSCRVVRMDPELERAQMVVRK